MYMKIEKYKRIEALTDDVDGVFALSDLRVLLDTKTDLSLYRFIKKLVDAGELIKVKRGLYAVPNAPLQEISARIEPRSYISTDTVLAKKGVIGTVPVRKVQAVKVGKPRIYKCKLGVIEHLSISPTLFFGYETEDGRLKATPEKAFLDVCYYCYKGKRFAFDPYSDVNIDLLDSDTVERYLKKYDDRFLAYFRRIWGTIQ